MDLANFGVICSMEIKIYMFLLKVSINILSFVQSKYTHGNHHLCTHPIHDQPNTKLSYNYLSHDNNIIS